MKSNLLQILILVGLMRCNLLPNPSWGWDLVKGFTLLSSLKNLGLYNY